MLGCFNLASGTSRSDWLLVGSLRFQRMPENYVASSVFTRKSYGLGNEEYGTTFLWYNEKIKYSQRIEKQWYRNLRFFQQLRQQYCCRAVRNASVVLPISVNCRMFRTAPLTPNIHTQSHGRKWSKIAKAEDGITTYTVTVRRHTNIKLLPLRVQSLEIRTLPDGAGIFVL
jgi:hypothetical protein